MIHVSFPASITTSSLCLVAAILVGCGKDVEEELAVQQPLETKTESLLPKFQASNSPTSKSSPLPFASREIRTFRLLSDQDMAALSRLMSRFWESDDLTERLSLLDEIESDYYGEEVIAFTKRLIASDRASLRQRAISMLAGNTSPVILDALSVAGDDPDETIRLSAILAASRVESEGLVDHVGRGFDDTSEKVRLGSFDILENQSPSGKLRLLDRALSAPHLDVQTTAIGELTAISSHDAIEVLFRALDSPIAEVREDARLQIDFVLDQDLRTAEDARLWWEQNADSYDADLVLIEEAG